MNYAELLQRIEELSKRVEELERNNIDFDKELYTVPEVAKMLGLTREAVYCMIKRGELPTIKLGTIKIRAVDIHNLLGRPVE